MPALISVFFLLAGPWLISVLTTSPEVQQAAETYLPWAAVTGLTGALAFLMDGVFIGATWSTDMRNRMLMSFAGYLVALAVFVPLLANHGLWLAMNGFLLVPRVLPGDARPAAGGSDVPHCPVIRPAIAQVADRFRPARGPAASTGRGRWSPGSPGPS